MDCGAEEGDEVCTQKGRTQDGDNKMARRIDGGELGDGDGGGRSNRRDGEVTQKGR